MFLAIGLSSCALDANKKSIVGTWTHSQSYTEWSDDGFGNIEILYEGAITYTDAGIAIEKGRFTYSITITDEESFLEGAIITLKYNLSVLGTYSVSNTTLTEKGKDVDISFVSADTNLPNGNNGAKQELIKSYRRVFEQNVNAEIKKALYDNNISEIINISETKMILKDSEGEVTEYYKYYER